MMRRIIGASVERRALVIVAALAVIVVGLLQLDNSRVEGLPEFTPPFVEVQTEALGLSAAEVEQLITVPLEADLLNGVAWMEDITSQSMPGLSSILMTFEPGTNVLDARQVVQERLTQAAGLPNVSRAPAMVQPLSSESRIMMIGLSSEEVSLLDMSVLARWTIRPRLMGVNGVANVIVWGQRERQLQVRVDPVDLEAAGLVLNDVIETAGNALWVSPLSYLEASTPGVGGFIDGPNQRIGVRHVLAITEPAHLEAVPIEGREDLTLGDVATVVEDHQPLIGDALVDEGDGLFLIIERFPWANSIDTTAAVESALDELRPGLTGINVDTDLFRPAAYLERSIDNVTTVTLVALILVALTFLVLAGSWRSAVVRIVSVIVAVMGTGLALYFLDTTINIMVLVGVAIAGLLAIDDSVSDSQGGASGTRALYAVVAMVVASVPVFVMEGAAGEFLPTIAKAMILGFVISLLVGATVTPALSSVLLPDGQPAPASAVSSILQKIEDVYLGLVDRVVGSPVIGGVGVVALLAVGLAIVPTLDREFVPQFEQTDVVVELEAIAGTSLQESRRIATKAASDLGQVPGVLSVGAHVGRAVLSDELVNVNSGQLWLKIDPDASYGSTIDAVRDVVDDLPGFGEPAVSTYTNSRIDDVLRQPNEDLVVRVYGENPDTLHALAGDIADLVSGVAGTKNVKALYPVLEPSVQIEVDLARAAANQVKPGDVRRAAATLLSGIEVGSLFEDQKVFEVVVWSPPEIRNSVTDIERLRINTPTGEWIDLSAVADVDVTGNQSVINRDAVSRYIDVVADIDGRSRDDIGDDITAQVRATGLPYEYHLRILDTLDESASTQRRVLATAAAALVTVYLILQAAFSSWRLATILAMTTALGLVGGVVALAVTGGTYSIGSAAGLFIIGGLALRGGLALLATYEGLQLDDEVELGPDLTGMGARNRLLPVITGHLAIALAVVPLVVFGTEAGLEVLRPMGAVVLGGVVSSAIVNLFLLPVLYARFARPASPHESLVAS